jgi:hypothetical protein
MRNFTLLMGALLAVGSASAQDFITEAPKVSTDTEKYIYRIASDRAQDLDYGTEIPLSDNPYLGLYGTTVAISGDETVVPGYTQYWYFTEAEDGAVYVHNLSADGVFSNGTIALVAEDDESATPFYILAIDGFDEGSFCISTADNYDGTTCIDVNNYLTGSNRANMKVCWNPISDGVGNNNNGSVFYFEEASQDDYEGAVSSYLNDYAEESINSQVDAAKEEIIAILKGYKNIPALWTSTDAIDAAIAKAEAVTGDTGNINSFEDVTAAVSAAQAELDAIAATATKTAGTGAIITLFGTYDGRPEYVVAGQEGTYGSYTETAYDELGEDGEHYFGVYYDEDGNSFAAVGRSEDADANAEWTMEYAGGIEYRLFNAANNCYFAEFAANIPTKGEKTASDAHSISWPTTEDVNNAALFTFFGAPDAEAIVKTAATDATPATYYEASECLNHVQLRGELNGDARMIHACGPYSNYNLTGFDNVPGDNYVEGRSTFLLNVVKAATPIEEDAIEEITVAPAKTAEGIYDLAGRRVSKATRGFYIINGVKTLVK